MRGCLRRIQDWIVLEYRCYRADHSKVPGTECWCMYSPSFFIKYTREEQQSILERDLRRIREMIGA